VRAATFLFFQAILRGDQEAEKTLSYASLRPLLRGVVSELEIKQKQTSRAAREVLSNLFVRWLPS
jgi:hypothetical protein